MANLGNGLQEVYKSNRMLDSLPKEVEERLVREARPVSPSQGEPIYEPHRPIRHVAFPLLGAGSIFIVYEDGTAIAVGTIGNEGVLGMPVYFGTGQTALAASAQVPSVMLKVPAGVFREVLLKDGQTQAVLARHTQALVTQLAVSGACNALHSARQRLARWLLMTIDRNEDETIQLSQEAFGRMLGLRRATVGEAAKSLEAMGLISHQYGRITVGDRAGLEEATCECYRSVRQEYDRLLGT